MTYVIKSMATRLKHNRCDIRDNLNVELHGADRAKYIIFLLFPRPHNPFCI